MKFDAQKAGRYTGLAIIVCSILSAGFFYIRDRDMKQAKADPAEQDVRFFPLRLKLLELNATGKLPRVNGLPIVGYLTDIPGEQNPKLYRTNFLMAQYALAPFIVENSTARDFLAGNFSGDQIDPTVLREKGLTVECSFGRGIFLLRRIGQAGPEGKR